MTEDKPASGFELTSADVEALLRDPSADNRASMAEKVAANLSAKEMGSSELPIAQDILRVLAQDAEVRVREALAREAAAASDLPKDVALSLAKDIASVANPVLEFSELLDDSDLIEIVKTSDEAKQVAIARREVVSESLSDALIEEGTETVVAELVGNAGAIISEAGFHKVVDKYGESELVQEPLIKRSEVPIAISERLVSLVSERLRDELIKNHDLPADMAADLLLQSRERATLGLLDDDAPPQNVEQLVDELYRNGRLTESIILRAACLGDRAFLEASTARLAKIPLSNAQILFDDSGDLGLQRLFQKTGLPKRVYLVLRKATDVMREVDYDGEAHDRERFSKKVLEHVLTTFEGNDIGLSDDDVDYLIRKLSTLTESAGQGQHAL